MNLQPIVQPRSANGLGSRRIDRESASRMDSKFQTPRTTSVGLFNAGLVNGSRKGAFESPRDRLIFISTCLIGHVVEVHVKNGSVLSGIFHAANAEKDFGIVLKMARVVKDGSARGSKIVSDIVKRPQTMVIPARELVQIIAKGISLTSDGMLSGHARDKRQDLMTDSAISQFHRVDGERELERWTPGIDDPHCPELDNVFDRHWDRNWDQFETNKALFGVKSTFNEELYTTKLERGPQMWEREREASRIAREIVQEETLDLHLAEERGVQLDENFDLDEETKFSSVYREIGDDLYKEHEDFDDMNTETFGDSFISMTSGQQEISENGVLGSASCSLWDEDGSSLSPSGGDIPLSVSTNNNRQARTDFIPTSISSDRLKEKPSGDQDGGKNVKDEATTKSDIGTSKYVEMHSSLDAKKSGMDKGILSASATAYSPSSLQENKDNQNESIGTRKVSINVNPQARPSSSASSASEQVGETSTSSCPGLSPSSSMGSLSSDKSTLNPHAKEFKLNPNAKSFVPFASVRPHAPVPESTIYFAPNAGLPHMQGLPVGVGIGPSFPGHQPVVYNPQTVQMQAPQTYVGPATSLYGQQMMLGQHRPVMYMPGYQPEMPYKGRDY